MRAVKADKVVKCILSFWGVFRRADGAIRDRYRELKPFLGVEGACFGLVPQGVWYAIKAKRECV